MGRFLSNSQASIAVWFRRLSVILSVGILSMFLAVSSASAQFLSDGVTPVTPIPNNTTFTAAISACLAESPVTGICPIYGDGSGYGDIENWDTSLVTDMGSALQNWGSFNGDISLWDTSNVTLMDSMFLAASSFNQDISQWDTSNVTNMVNMFTSANVFNQDISQWDTSNVTTMQSMFEGATVFNQDLSQWDTANVTAMNSMFRGATVFDQEIRGWDVSNVTDFSDMFNGATAFTTTYSGATGFGATPTSGFFTLSSDATLASLSVANSTAPIVVSPGTTNYFAVLPFQTSAAITLTVNQYSSAQASYASVTVDGTPVNLNTTGTGVQTVTLTAQPNAGQNVNIVVTAPDGTTLAYTLSIFHQSNDATLSLVSLSSGNLSPNFASGTFSYTATVGNSVSSVFVTAIPNESNAAVLVNGSVIRTVPLSVGNNTVSIQVTSKDGTSVLVYTVTVTRQSTDATLSALTLSSGSLSPSFASGVGELGPAGFHALVAARADREAVALGDRAHRRLEQDQHGDAIRGVMAQHLGAPSRVRAARPFDRAEGEPAGSEPTETRGGERPVAHQVDDSARTLEDRVLQIDAASRVTERSVASCLKRSPHRLAEDMRQRAHLGDEGQPPAPDLADGAAPHQDALADVGPVHAPDLDLRVVPAAVEDVGLGDPVGGQYAFGVLRIDGQVRARTDLRGGQPALGLEVGAVEAERPVVIGEAEGDAIGPGDPPAPGERRRAVVEMGVQSRSEGLHRRSSSSGIKGTRRTPLKP